MVGPLTLTTSLKLAEDHVNHVGARRATEFDGYFVTLSARTPGGISSEGSVHRVGCVGEAYTKDEEVPVGEGQEVIEVKGVYGLIEVGCFDFDERARRVDSWYERCRALVVHELVA